MPAIAALLRRKVRNSCWPRPAAGGYSLGELAALAGIPIPRDLKRDKGWTGILLELWLGASAGSKPEQDFAALGSSSKRSPSTAGSSAGDHLRLRRPVNRQ
jgi:DNA mismatch repair endonuclease MutH